MDKEYVAKTNMMWRRNIEVNRWIEVLKHPEAHVKGDIPDEEYMKAVSGIQYILLGEEVDEEVSVMKCLPARAQKILRRNGITTIAEMQNHTYKDLLELKFMGTKTLDELVAYLHLNGYALKDAD